MHWLGTPIILSQWASSAAWAAILAFMQVFFYWSLNLIAVELENPFGKDANDVNASELQEAMNRALVLLLDPSTKRTPRLLEIHRNINHKTIRADGPRASTSSFRDIFKCLSEHT